jgi:hypothetical protein
MRNIKYNEFNFYWGASNVSNIIMTYRALDVTDRILWDFLSGHLMHLQLIVHSDRRSTSFVLIKTWSLSSWVGPMLFSVNHIFLCHEQKDSIFIWCQQWNDVTTGILLLLRLNCVLKRSSQKEKQIKLFLLEMAAYRCLAPIRGWSKTYAI